MKTLAHSITPAKQDENTSKHEWSVLKTRVILRSVNKMHE